MSYYHIPYNVLITGDNLDELEMTIRDLKLPVRVSVTKIKLGHGWRLSVVTQGIQTKQLENELNKQLVQVTIL